jgi:predicted nucleic acid-binding protein
MADAIVDSNVLLDVLTEDPEWFTWSSEALAREAQQHTLWINIIIYAEVSVAFERVEDLAMSLAGANIGLKPIPPEAAFLAGKCFLRYRRGGGMKRSPLPDFLLGRMPPRTRRFC